MSKTSYKSLYKAALKKLGEMTDEELKQFVGEPTGTLMTKKNLQLHQNINTQLKENREKAQEEMIPKSSVFQILEDYSSDVRVFYDGELNYEYMEQWAIKHGYLKKEG